MKLNTYQLLTAGLVSLTTITGLFLTSSFTHADGDSAVDQTEITVPASCTMSGSGQTSHTATINPGVYSGASGSQYENGIGKTTLTTFCNDYDGFSIYAIGFTNNEEGNNTLKGTSASGNATITTKVYAEGDTVSNWSMKVNKVENPSQGDPVAWNPSNMTIANSFGSWHTVPDDYAKVVEYKASTGSSATDATLGAKLETTYATYISPTQAADTYTGQVKYVMVHPSVIIPNRLNVTYDANGLSFSNGKSTNIVTYDATSATGKGNVTKKSYVGSYQEDGSFSGYDVPAGNQVVTIDGAESIHIVVTYGAPQNNGGPPSDLMIWAGNHPDYTNTNSDTSLSSCGSTSAVNGAYSGTGGSGTQVTMECDITGDSVTFYDYSAYTYDESSMGYYAVITGEGDVTTYNKTIASGNYEAPATTAGTNHFYGWSTNPNANYNAEEPLYADGADFLANAQLVNNDGNLTLYAVWGKSFNATYAEAGKSQVNGHYIMQDSTADICKQIYVGATETLIDSRDNTTYTVGRLKDGNCWMLDNLALDLMDSTILNSLSAANTNIDPTNETAILTSLKSGNRTAGSQYATVGISSWTSSHSFSVPLVNLASKDMLPTTIANSEDPMKDAVIAGNWKVGGYYNYCAVSAGSYCYGDGDSNWGTPSGNATSSICPKGWRLPTGDANGEYQALYDKANTYTAYRSALHLPLSGMADNGSSGNYGNSGGWWSSTLYDGFRMYDMDTHVIVDPAYPSTRYFGHTVRCILDH